METLKYYESNYIATVSINDGEIRVEGGPAEKRKLREAKRKTRCCYVRDIQTKSGIQLILQEGEWVIGINK